MSMPAETAPAVVEGTPPVAPEATPVPASSTPESTVPASPAAESDPFDNAEVQTFERSYVEKLRKEAADRRTAAKAYEDAFSGYSPEQREGWLSLAQSLASDDPTVRAEAAKIMQEVSNDILGAGSITETGEKPAGEPDLGEKQFLTEEQLEAKLAEREQKAAIDAEVRKVNEEVAALGYKEGTPDYNDLMWRAVNQHDHDLQAAHAARQAERQAVIDSYLADIEKNGAPRLPGAGQPGNQPSAITDFKGARASVEARIAAAMGGA